jgi:potassium efflux system protein
MRHRWLLIIVALVTWAAGAVSLSAQQDASIPIRAQLDGHRLELGQIEVGLQNRDIPDSQLSRTRQRLETILFALRGIADEAVPRAEAIRARLKELGPKPDEKAPRESAEVTAERDEREKALKEADETVRLARRLIVQVEQLIADIADKRRAAFAEQLFRRSASLLSPGLWIETATALPTDVAAASVIARDAVSRASDRIGPIGTVALFVCFAAVILLAWFARSFACRIATSRLKEPTSLALPLSALASAAIGFGMPAAAGFLIQQVATGTGVLPPRLEPVLAGLLGGIAFVGLVKGLADGILAPERPAWRIVTLPNSEAERIVRLVTAVAVLLVVERSLESFYQAIAAGLPLTMVTRGGFILVIALMLAREIRTFGRLAREDEEAFGHYVVQGGSALVLARFAGWLSLVGAVGAVLVGYMALASFLIDQIIWVGILAAFLVLLVRLVDAATSVALAPDGRILLRLQSATGLSRRALQQVGVLFGGLARVFFGGFVVLLVLAPWGVESGDLLFSLRSAVFGFTIGDVTISFAAVFSAVILFAIGIALTRGLQGWLKTRFLPQTEMDAGLKNSVTTGLGYVGFLAAATVGLASLGLSLDKVAIVAGALSVGIGFGLQSIVNNFVSGLILLWERPIRVGDLITVGTDQGYVRRINVRSTEIDTFDRATVIVPNSNLVSGVVKNQMYSDRTGRVVVPLPMPREVDTDRVAALLREAAEAHPDVVDDPSPRVLLKTIGSSTLDFELVCFVGEVETAARVTSDLNFAVWRRIREEGILPPPAPRSELGVEMIKEVRVRLAEGGAAEDERKQ